ncbi:MAG: ParB/RepB/Spo0J family partition protein [Balneolales bacterium]|nr:ParB/RepB/Spo0J family partition protein [Balneolales bacterium]
MAKKVLGRGLSVYFPDMDKEDASESSEKSANPSDKTAAGGQNPAKSDTEGGARLNVILNIPIDSIRTNPHQPRKEFDSFRLQELSESIEQHGLIQPITVRHLGRDRYELISGERRLRATRMAGIDTIPSYIREANDEELITFAIIENIQREELNPVEVALGYQRLIDECSLTQEMVAKKVGKNRTTVTNMLRLLNLPAAIQAGLKTGKLSTGHARTLVSVEDPDKQEELYKKTLENELSVRELEELVRLIGKPRKKGASRTTQDANDPAIREITSRLRRTLATKVNIRKKQRGGEIKIEYYSDDELERLLNLFDNLHS